MFTELTLQKNSPVNMAKGYWYRVIRKMVADHSKLIISRSQLLKVHFDDLGCPSMATNMVYQGKSFIFLFRHISAITLSCALAVPKTSIYIVLNVG